MNIIDNKLEFNSNISKMGNVDTIVLHHSGVAVLQSVETIHNYHKNSNGWAGIGYHYYVRKDGSIYKGRDEKYAGAHCPGKNSTSIGICAEGDFEQEQMSEVQKNAIIELITDIKTRYNIKEIRGHKDYIATSCPGKNFPLNEIVNGTAEKEKVEIKKEQITVDGKWGKETTMKAQKVFGTTVDGIVSNQYTTYKDKNKGLLSSTFEWKEKPSKNGSQLIGAIQEKIGVKKDKFIGPDTIKAMQKWLGTTQDGYVSNPSEMVKAFQKWLNEQ